MRWGSGAGQPTRSKLWLFFALVSFLLALTHPIPLLLLIFFCCVGSTHPVVPAVLYSRITAGSLLGLAVACVSFLYPLASVDRSRSASNLRGFGLHKDALISSLALFGISPFDTL